MVTVSMRTNDPNFKLQPFFLSKEAHSFHLVDSSMLPVVTGMASFITVMNMVFHWHPTAQPSIISWDTSSFKVSIMLFVSILFSWFLQVLRESAKGHHTDEVRYGLTLGMILFIMSEVMFFVAFFWGFFHFTFSPSLSVGYVWPPKSMQPLDVWGLPLTNTLLLLSSGATITWAHHLVMTSKSSISYWGFAGLLAATMALGLIFLYCQGVEYLNGVTFSWKESVFGSSFFATTGFHGFHVCLGTLFLIFCLGRHLMTGWEKFDSNKINNNRLTLAQRHDYQEKFFYIMHRIVRKLFLTREKKFTQWIKLVNKFHDSNLGPFAFTKSHHFGFEAAAWYWHFVDVVWLFLFVAVYWWGA